MSIVQKHHYCMDFTIFEHGERIVELYTIPFHELVIFALRIVEDEQEMKAMFADGMRCSIQKVMPALDECTMNQLYNQAIQPERDFVKPKKAKGFVGLARYKFKVKELIEAYHITNPVRRRSMQISLWQRWWMLGHRQFPAGKPRSQSYLGTTSLGQTIAFGPSSTGPCSSWWSAIA